MYLWKSIIKFMITIAILGAYPIVNAQPLPMDNSPPIPTIKAGDVTFAKLETVIEGDSPKQIITATIIDGKLKGAKLQGKLIRIKNATSLIFHQLSIEGKEPKAKKINAYAIEFDAARIAIVSEAEFPWLKRRSLEMASKFLKNNHNDKDQLKMGVGSDFGILFMKDVG